MNSSSFNLQNQWCMHGTLSGRATTLSCLEMISLKFSSTGDSRGCQPVPGRTFVLAYLEPGYLVQKWKMKLGGSAPSWRQAGGCQQSLYQVYCWKATLLILFQRQYYSCGMKLPGSLHPADSKWDLEQWFLAEVGWCWILSHFTWSEKQGCPICCPGYRSAPFFYDSALE